MEERSRRSRFVAFVRAYPVHEALRDAWAEHRWYVGLAFALFAVGAAIGVVLALAGVNLLEVITEFVGQDPLPDVEDDELTARFFVLNNSIPFVLAIVGAVSFGLYTAWIMVFNGILVGNLAAIIAPEAGIAFVIVGLLPHGIFELPALFVASGVGFRLFHRLAQRVLGRREAFLTRRYVYRTAILVVVGWLLLVVAAFVEAYVTTALLDLLFPELSAEGGEAEAAAAVALVAGSRTAGASWRRE